MGAHQRREPFAHAFIIVDDGHVFVPYHLRFSQCGKVTGDAQVDMPDRAQSFRQDSGQCQRGEQGRHASAAMRRRRRGLRLRLHPRYAPMPGIKVDEGIGYSRVRGFSHMHLLIPRSSASRSGDGRLEGWAGTHAFVSRRHAPQGEDRGDAGLAAQ